MTSEINAGYKKKLGNIGEDIAESFFRSKGFEIIKRNYRFGKIGEIDIIVRKSSLIIFAEVKNRNTGEFGGAYYSITERKKQTLKKVAGHFLHTHSYLFLKDITYRYDMIAVDRGKVEWIEDIFR
jgi:putative endonuclease